MAIEYNPIIDCVYLFIKLSDICTYIRIERAVQCHQSVSRGRMSSMEQLSRTVAEHLGPYATTNWTIQESPISGRGLIATEDILTGEVLFADHPLIYGPRSGNSIQRGCTVCGKLDSDTFFKCSKCALLLCSEQCHNSSLHYNDCNIISRWSNKVSIEEVDNTFMSRALAAIRVLFLNEDQKRFMTELEAHTLPQNGHEINDIKTFFEFSEEEENLMKLACCVMDANAFQIATPFRKKEMSMRGLFPVAALMNHSCVPNTSYAYNSESRMIVKAVKPIQAGTEIFTCYTGILWGTPARRTHLYKTKYFMCSCERCADPTERGTHLAALKCFSNQCPGFLLPVEPLKPASAWRCLECSLRVPNKNVCAIQNALGSMMGSLNFENVDQLETFLGNRVTKFIPKTNQIVVDLQCRLIWELGDAEGLRWQGELNLKHRRKLSELIISCKLYSDNPSMSRIPRILKEQRQNYIIGL